MGYAIFPTLVELWSRQGASTQTGTTPARRARVAGAWASRATVRRPRHVRLAKHATPLQAIRWPAQGRWGPRSRHAMARGQHATPVVGARARARVACRGARAQQGTVTRKPSPLEAWCRPREAGDHTPSAATPPQSGGTRDGVPRPSGRRVPRVRPAPDGPTEGGGSHPTESRVLNRRGFLAPALPMDEGKHRRKTSKSCLPLLTSEGISTLAVSRAPWP
jgi:hypothetical protein